MDYENLVEKIDIKSITNFPKEILKEYNLLPIKNDSAKVMFITDKRPPLNIIDDLRVYSNSQIEFRLIATALIKVLIGEYLEAPLDTVEGMLSDFKENELDEYINLNLDSKIENLEELANEAPIIRLVNTIITTGLKRGASDIHLEPFEDKIKIRYRIDGYLYEEPAPPKSLFPAIVTRIKIISNLDIAERRLPQDGRVRIKVLGRELDVRISIIPNLYGESIVLRLLDRAEILLELDNLGFNQDLMRDYSDLISYSNGIILVTGPTGSGKTTTLYATLNHLNSSEKKIVTIEDPVEYQIDGINQIQVKPEIDFTFANGLRAILRHDPDIVMVGEIRDVETAKIAIQAALTGHLVFATLHTNDAVGAVTRLIEMGIEHYLLASALRGIMAQRLVRVLCPECKKEYYPNEEELGALAGELERVYLAQGCDKCNQIAFKGRTSIYELLIFDEELKSLLTHQKGVSEVRNAVKKKGIKSLFEDGVEKVKAGITTLDEVFRATKN
ncbi:type II secretion system protein GspE [Orenia metallireducens]|uniref:Type II secretion system protein GspE n=1 Tax=Orenia metallireducens TaxID=1413210 RepID=A0A1C0A702_9FIRM|nr:GspE/PulE family protein [Orenia metallireducens]OCL25994.1 type II secretion system protein GspE [Orenia metallireducens]